MLRELTVNEFTAVLAEGKATPGGGAAAALSASLAAALTSMVFNLTIDKKAARDYPDSVVQSMKEARENTDKFRERYLQLMVDDANSFDELMAGFSLPKDTDEQIAERKQRIDKSKERVLEVPLQLAKESFDMYDSLKIATEYGNKNAISDAGVAAILIHSAIEGAALNVFINLAGSEVNEENINLKVRTDELVEKSKSLKEDIVAMVIDKIYGRQ